MLIKGDMESPPIGSVPSDLPDLSRAARPKPSDRRILSLCAPYLYLTGAFAAFFATLYVTDWFWILPHSVLLSAATVHLVLAVKRR